MKVEPATQSRGSNREPYSKFIWNREFYSQVPNFVRTVHPVFFFLSSEYSWKAPQLIFIEYWDTRSLPGIYNIFKFNAQHKRVAGGCVRSEWEEEAGTGWVAAFAALGT